MKKFLVVGHGNFSKGLKSILELFLGNMKEFTYLCAYTDEAPDLDKGIDEFLESISDEDQGVIFTDIYGGSVNQKVTMKSMNKKNIFVVSGVNVPLILEIVSLSLSGENYSFDNIENVIKKMRLEMKQVELIEGLSVSSSKTSICNENGQKTVEANTPNLLAKRPETSSKITLRIDERLIHGQIAMVWSKELALDGIIVASDEVVENEMQQNALRMAAPSGVKVLMRSIDEAAEILNDNRSATKNIIVLVRTVRDAVRVVSNTKYIDRVNVGNVGKMVEGDRKKYAPTILLTKEESESLNELVKLFPETDFQMVPAEKKELAKNYI